MQHAIDKASALVEAHQYIRRFRGRVVVVKVGGSIMDEMETDSGGLRGLIEDVCFMHAVGMRPIVVHGGGKAISAAMNEAGLEAQFVRGRRYTDERTLAIAEHVLVRQINGPINQMIADAGPTAMGLHSLASCAVFGKRLFLTEPPEEGDGASQRQSHRHRSEEGRASGGKRIDIGLVGEVEWVNGELLRALLEARVIPTIAPIARDAAGSKLNINADSVAGHVAAATKADKLVLVSDTHGIRTSEDAADLASHLTRDEIGGLIESGVITAGMLPKVEAAFTALDGGVDKVHVIDGRIPHSLLLEIYTEKGIGTEIVSGAGE